MSSSCILTNVLRSLTSIVISFIVKTILVIGAIIIINRQGKSIEYMNE